MGRLVDFHSHFFSRAFFEALAERSPLPGIPSERMSTAAGRAGIDLPPEATELHLGRWLAEADRYGVGHLVTFASVPEERAAVADAVRRAGGRLSALLVIDPTRPEAAERLAGALEDDDYKGALFFPAMHGYRLGSEEFRRVLRVLGDREAIALVHCGMLRIALRDRFQLPRRYDLTLADPLALVPVADAHPRVRFVIPHFGGGFFREALMAGAQCENLLVDTSSSNSWVDTQPVKLTLADVFERTLKVFGPRRILFGTDSSVFPRGWRHDVLRAQREALGACGVSEADREAILGGNAARILGLPS